MAYSIFINRLDYEQVNRRSMSKKALHVPYWQPYRGGPRIFMRNDGCPDENDLQRYETLINSTTQIYWPDNSLSDLVWEVCGPYFAGDKTLDDTIRLLNNRVGLYVNEQK